MDDGDTGPLSDTNTSDPMTTARKAIAPMPIGSRLMTRPRALLGCAGVNQSREADTAEDTVGHEYRLVPVEAFRMG